MQDSGPQIAVPFGKYLLIKRLAVGGMAELFLAQDDPHGALVVIKRILPYLSSEPGFVKMFLDEARIAVQLRHPNIVQVHELGKLEESIFIAMDYVEGIDLRKISQEEAKGGQTVPYAIAARILADICAGLQYAHHCKGVDGRPMEIVHRDVSPQNVMVGYDGQVKLVDFGIARANAFMERSAPGVLKGKFLYLSPEQVLQEPLDHRSDLFAIGSVLYEITTGKSPFHRPSAEAVIFAIRREDPPAPGLVRADYPPELARIVVKCLTKDRRARYQEAGEIKEDLETFLRGQPLTDNRTVGDYVGALFGTEDERTILNIPTRKGGSGTLIARPVLAPPPVQARPPPLPEMRQPPPEDEVSHTLNERAPPAPSPRAARADSSGITEAPTDPRAPNPLPAPRPPPPQAALAGRRPTHEGQVVITPDGVDLGEVSLDDRTRPVPRPADLGAWMRAAAKPSAPPLASALEPDISISGIGNSAITESDTAPRTDARPGPPVLEPVERRPVVVRPPIPRRPTRLEQVAGAPHAGGLDRTGSFTDLSQSTTFPLPPSHRRRKRLLLALVTTFLALLIGVATWRLFGPK